MLFERETGLEVKIRILFSSKSPILKERRSLGLGAFFRIRRLFFSLKRKGYDTIVIYFFPFKKEGLLVVVVIVTATDPTITIDVQPRLFFRGLYVIPRPERPLPRLVKQLFSTRPHQKIRPVYRLVYVSV